jgi:hypothetical protein
MISRSLALQGKERALINQIVQVDMHVPIDKGMSLAV